MTKSSSWKLAMASGGKPLWMGSPSASSTSFSSDGKYAIVLMTHEIRVYFIGTRQCIRTISINLTGVVDSTLDPSNNNQIILFKSSGEITTVNWKDKLSQPIVSNQQITFATAASLSASPKPKSSHQKSPKSSKVSSSLNSSSQVSSPVNILSIISIQKDYIYLITGKKEKPSPSAPSASSFASLSAHTRHIIQYNRETSECQEILDVSNVIKYSISLNRKKLCFITSNSECLLVEITRAVTDESPSETKLNSEIIPFVYRSPVTSLAVSNDSVIAIGTAAGAIQILYGGIVEAKPQRLLKWHIDQVRSLNFTPEGNYLLSGGLEKVLVFWQLDTDKTQFLPRLNGTIEKISIDRNKSDYYTLMLKIPLTSVNAENKDNSNTQSSNDHVSANTTNDLEQDDEEASYEVLVVSAVDLVSRLSINGIRPKFTNAHITNSLTKTRKRFIKLGNNYDVSKLKHDYTSIFEVHPKTQQLYFPRGASIQGYDLIKNEQSFIQNAAPLLSTGKVRSESKLIDPEISCLSFTFDGQWMCTFDTISTSEVDNLLSKNDQQYALKFWKFVENSNNNNSTPNGVGNSATNGHWELSTKIIDPHGPSNSILSITPAPSTYHNGLAFLTADDKGGLRVWRPRVPKEVYQKALDNSAAPNGGKLQQTAWTLRKSKPSGALVSNAVSTCWSDDGSIIVLGHESSILAFNTHDLEEIQFQIPAMSGSRIRSLSILGNHLIVLSKTRITSFDLLSGAFTPLNAKVNTTLGAKNLIAIDKVNGLVCLAVNYYNDNENQLRINSKILVFKPDTLEPVYSVKHEQGISSIRHFRSSFIFVDLDSRVGVVSSANAELGSQEANDFDLSTDMNSMLLEAQAAADIVNNRNVNTNSSAPASISNGGNDEISYTKVVSIDTFSPIFENLEGVQIDTLFDKIMKSIK